MMLLYGINEVKAAGIKSQIQSKNNQRVARLAQVGSENKMSSQMNSKLKAGFELKDDENETGT